MKINIGHSCKYYYRAPVFIMSREITYTQNITCLRYIIKIKNYNKLSKKISSEIIGDGYFTSFSQNRYFPIMGPIVIKLCRSRKSQNYTYI